ncbi:cytochrome b [Dokdonella sp.]|uniref:cytochrome b n=1 Tax=Dokdonella sp. TaxID=2291710 RepID=UPI0031BC62B8|nr:cytochrome b [Dokdonella sp.]
MQLKSDTYQWGSLAKTFHWLIVVLILAQATLGLYMVSLPKRPSIIPYYTFHKSLGLTILLLAVLRLLWRAVDARPRMPAAMPAWQVAGAKLGHALLYGLLFAVPLSGWLFDSASSLRPLYWWHLVKMPALTHADKAFAQTAQLLHESLFWALASVALAHAAVAIFHHFVSRDDVLRRMLPGRRATPESSH